MGWGFGGDGRSVPPRTAGRSGATRASSRWLRPAACAPRRSTRAAGSRRSRADLASSRARAPPRRMRASYAPPLATAAAGVSSGPAAKLPAGAAAARSAAARSIAVAGGVVVWRGSGRSCGERGGACAWRGSGSGGGGLCGAACGVLGGSAPSPAAILYEERKMERSSGSASSAISRGGDATSPGGDASRGEGVRGEPPRAAAANLPPPPPPPPPPPRLATGCRLRSRDAREGSPLLPGERCPARGAAPPRGAGRPFSCRSLAGLELRRTIGGCAASGGRLCWGIETRRLGGSGRPAPSPAPRAASHS